MGPRAWWGLARIALGVRESSIIDLPRIVRGFRFSLDAMWAETSKLNLFELAPVLQMPVFFFLGRNDHWVPPEVSVAYFEALTAPSKQLVWFEQSGHEPFVDEPAKFNAAMAELIPPVLRTDPLAAVNVAPRIEEAEVSDDEHHDDPLPAAGYLSHCHPRRSRTRYWGQLDDEGLNQGRPVAAT